MMQVDLIADIWLYPTNEGGKLYPIRTGYRCPCIVEKDLREGWDC
jgi:hypothetical protein